MTLRRLCSVVLASLILAGILAAPASAGPIITSTVHLTDRFTPNPLSSLPDGDFVQVGATVAGSSTSDPFASLSVVATQGASTLTLPFFPFTAPIVTDPAYVAFIPYAGAPLGSWSITATDSTGSSAPVLSPPIAAPQLLPFVTGITVSDNTSTPTVSWTLPDLTGFDVDFTRIRVIDFSTEVQVFAALLPTTTTSFAVPAGILQPGRSYIYRVSLEDFEVDAFGTHLENRSNAFSGVVQVVPEPATCTLALVGLAGIGGSTWWRSRSKRAAVL
jgi:hypothetical protein